LQTEAARTWLSQTGDSRIRVDSADGGEASGRIVGTNAQTVRLQGADGRMIDVPVRDGTRLRDKNSVSGGMLGALGGGGLGLVAGLVLNNNLGTPNPDSAGGIERPPLVIPISFIAGLLVGAIVGTERRLEVHPTLALPR
jgi:hypothetical protein